MENWTVPVATLIVGAIVSAAATYFATRAQWRLNYDADLREKRIDAYADLWGRLQPLAKFHRPAPFSGDDATKLAGSLQEWYFTKGGIFLSMDARRDYFAVQDALEFLDSGWGWQTPERLALTPGGWEHIRTYGSRLRTSLTLDVGTRTRPKMPGAIEPFDRSLAGVYERDDGARLALALAQRFGGRTPRLTLTSPGGAEVRDLSVVEWAPARSSLRAVIPDDLGRPQERVIWIERGQLIEGPPLYAREAGPAVLWHRIDPPPVAEVRGRR
jgi:hypothetical protein